jgi:hypothetical protein
MGAYPAEHYSRVSLTGLVALRAELPGRRARSDCLLRSTTASPIRRMGTSVKDGWRESSRTLGRAPATAAPPLSSVRASSRAHRSPRQYRPRARRRSRPPSAGQPLHGELRNRTELITLAPRDSASATEQVGFFRVTADAMAHRPLPGRRCPWLSVIARPLQPRMLHARSPLPVLTTSALSLVGGSPALLVNDVARPCYSASASH